MIREKKPGEDELIVQHLDLVRGIAGNMHGHVPPTVHFDDLYSAGVIGLIQAIRAFSDDRSCSLIAFARHRIRGAMLDYLRQIDWASRDHRHAIRRQEAEEMRFLSLTTVSSSGEEELLRTEGSCPPDQEQRTAAAELWRIIEKALAHLTPRTCRILELYYVDELTMAEIAKIFGVNESRISQIHTKALANLRPIVEGLGVTGVCAVLI